MANKINPNRRGSIQVSIRGEKFEEIWNFLESCDEAGVDRSTEIWRLALAADRNEDLQMELSKNYPAEYMTDDQLKLKAKQLPLSWSILPRVDKAIEEGCREAAATIQIEKDMADPEWWERMKVEHKRLELQEEIATLEKKVGGTPSTHYPSERARLVMLKGELAKLDDIPELGMVVKQ